jgi:large-conductance mechanosensitive channel
MLTFLLEEGVLTVGAMSDIFTATLLGSFKSNILDPVAETLIPSHQLDKHAQIQENILDANNYSKESGSSKSQFGNNKIKWQTFIKDLTLWVIIMFIIYLVWKKLIKKIKDP